MRKLALGLIAGLVLTAAAAHAVPEVKREKTFPPGGHIHGYVVDPAGEGVSGWVALEGLDGCRFRAVFANSYRRGRFDIDNLLPGRYKLRVESIYRPDSDLVPGDAVEVEVKADKVSRPHLVLRCDH